MRRPSKPPRICETCGKAFTHGKTGQRACSRDCRRRRITDAERERLRQWSAVAGRKGSATVKRRHFERIRAIIGSMSAEQAYAKAYRAGYSAGSGTGEARGYSKGYERGYEAALKERGLWQTS